MKTFLFLLSLLCLFQACDKNNTVTEVWPVLNDTIFPGGAYRTYTADLDNDGSDDVQFEFISNTSAGGMNAGSIDMVIMKADMHVYITTVTDTFCVDTIDHDTYVTYDYHNCFSENFYDTKNFTYTPVFSKDALPSISFAGNTTDTVQVSYHDYSDPPGSFPDSWSTHVYEGQSFDADAQYFLFETDAGKRFGLGVRAESYYIIFTDVVEP